MRNSLVEEIQRGDEYGFKVVGITGEAYGNRIILDLDCSGYINLHVIKL